ncbi:tyrosine-type recombinase/integrase [Nocardia sp. NPDC049737]|uniref:tyrosine-type recombinase/integrase n=1 Tax=Nocardia sp. NPDC049737 TaxID=3154358 RepID=UPI0034446887
MRTRHTFACRLINRDVPQEVLRVLPDHESSRMTAHYARITNQTIRQARRPPAKAACSELHGAGRRACLVRSRPVMEPGGSRLI